ncbi:MAG: hypothetical protein JXJ17_19585 [Anaerolineae bacterium]|nr:hypothetical protein [Anaerolineae bacterium]
MRRVFIRKPHHVTPFNEPASSLRVLNRQLRQWQRDLLAPLTDIENFVDSLESINTNDELLVVSDNLWFNEAYIKAFLDQARQQGTAVRAAFTNNDPAYHLQSPEVLSRSYEARGSQTLIDLWYFPNGPAKQVEPLVIQSKARKITYANLPPLNGDREDGLTWWVPEQAACAIDNWVHLFLVNIVYGLCDKIDCDDARAGKPRSGRPWRFRPIRAINGPVSMGDNCRIDPTAILKGPLTLGRNVTIGPGCVISQSMIGNNVTLTHANNIHHCVISDDSVFAWGANAYFSAFMRGVTIAQSTAIEMSLVGRDTYIGAGTIFTDFDLLARPLQVEVNSHPVDIALPMLGVCVGHNCRLGAGLVVYPARTIESDVVLMTSPGRRVIMGNIGYEESDHHELRAGDLHPRRYPREYEQNMEVEW